jgi:hypothetical protein
MRQSKLENGSEEEPLERLSRFLLQILPRLPTKGTLNVIAKELTLLENFMKIVLPILLIVITLLYLFRYRRSVKKRLKEFQEATDVMVRVQDPKDGIVTFRILELTPEFLDKHKDKWQLMSLGEYLSTLRPAVLPGGVTAPQFVQHEMERFLAASLLNYLGPSFGAAILPMLGFSNIQSYTGNIALHVANWFASHFIMDQAGRLTDDPSQDKGTFPFSFNELSAFANLNQKFRGANNGGMTTTPLDLLKQGEVAYSPSFGDDNDLIPNPFVVDLHWEKATTGMESLMKQAQHQSPTVSGAESSSDEPAHEFDPHDRSFPEPTPINQRLFPDLHRGWGSAKCTHTKREIIRNRLFAVLLNRLAHNYYSKEQGIEEEFAVKFAGIHITSAHGFLWALAETGHDVRACPRGANTTFGMAACVKEKDGSWTNLPLAYFLRTGYENESSRPSHTALPHGGMDLGISGPLVGKGSKCNIQFYMAIEGMCGWHSNHNADVPWIIATASTEPYSKDMTLQAVRMASLLSVIFNAIGTEQNLPFGGYGVLGVCNDTAALLDQALRGTTNMYPLVSTGRYLIDISKRLVALRKGLCVGPKFADEGKDILQMIAATMDISSDLQASPSNVLDGIPRYLACLSKTTIFQLESESKETMTSTLHTFEKYHAKRPEIEKSWSWKTRIDSIRKVSPPSKERSSRRVLEE